MHFENLTAPAGDTPLSDMEISGARFDLSQSFVFLGLTYAGDQDEATLGFSATAPMQVIRGAQAFDLEGLVLHFAKIGRFEVAFERPAGSLEYFEFRHDPEPALLFFFEGGTIRVAAGLCQAELVLAGEDDDETLETGAPTVQ